jgi:LacI family transcriptional regulator of maltose regulon
VLECESSQKQAAEAMAALLRQPTITAVLCYNNVIATGAWFGRCAPGGRAAKISVESYFEQRVALAAFAETSERRWMICR